MKRSGTLAVLPVDETNSEHALFAGVDEIDSDGYHKDVEIYRHKEAFSLDVKVYYDGLLSNVSIEPWQIPKNLA